MQISNAVTKSQEIFSVEALFNRALPVEKQKGGSNDIPFGAIILGESDGLEILCSVRTTDTNYGFAWKAVPLGLRSGNNHGYFGVVESFHSSGYGAEFLKNVILNSQARIYDFVSDIRLHPDRYGHTGPNPGLNSQIHPVIVEKIRTLGINSGYALDIGCGKGELVSAIKKAFSGMEIYGLDNDERNASDAKKNLGNGNIVLGNAEELICLFKGIGFDVITASALLEKDVLDRSAAIEILRASFSQLNPGGVFIASGYGPLLVGRKEMEDIGFKVSNSVVADNLFTYSQPKQLYIAVKPLASQTTH